METEQTSGLIRFQPSSTRRDGPSEDVKTSSPKIPSKNDRSWRPGDEEESDPEPGYPVRIAVRSVRLGDLLDLRGMTTVLALNQPEVNFSGYSPTRAAVTALAPRRKFRPRLFTAISGDRVIGFVHFQPLSPDQRWQLVAIGSATGVFEATPVWEELIAQAVVAAGLRGVKRLYGRAPSDSAASESLVAVGFSHYADEQVFVARPPLAGAQVKMRAQEQTDTWAIHQLYNSAVPRPVQVAEGYTSHRWDLRAVPEGMPGVSSSGWLIEERHQVIGYARIRSRGGVHTIELIYSPERIDVLDELIAGALAKVKLSGRKDCVYCAIRGYQLEAAIALERHGFTSILEQELHVKYTTANVRVAPADPIPFHAEVIEKLPKRVPSFLPGKPQDESAT
ncbi:MAG: hypothetical protein ACJ789_12560 [Thermomicrobiales bacterium]